MSPNQNTLSIDLSTSTVEVHPGATHGKRRDFLTPIPGEDGCYLLVVDSTAAEKIIRCPTAGRFYLVKGREGHAKDAALVFGGAIHEGLEAFYKGQSEQLQNEAIIRYFMENPTAPDEYRTPVMALLVMDHYRDQIKIRVDYQDETLSNEAGLIVEHPFELPLGVLIIESDIQIPQWNEPRYVKEIHVAWAGRIDRAVRNEPFNRVQDHKTTSIGGDQYIQSFQLSPQTLGYVWAGRQMWPEYDIRGFQLNAIHLKKPPKSGSLLDKGPRGGEPALNFFRAQYEYPPQRIEEWQRNMLTIIEDFVHSLVRDYFPMYTNHCFNKFGRCPYFDVCSIDSPEVRLRMLDSDAFKPVTWDPTSGR